MFYRFLSPTSVLPKTTEVIQVRTDSSFVFINRDIQFILSCNILTARLLKSLCC